MGNKVETNVKCFECGGKTTKSSSARYHCENEECEVYYFKKDRLGNVTKVVYGLVD